ncbi:Rieske (2Fe-2S) protein [Streptomyces sp. NPDC006551]|uniref:Rieske (2Fe-2S) protein n=1 Tax=Streptomyces sp. NPDC006551 TaxID=3157178 RepID=UPI0033B856DE
MSTVARRTVVSAAGGAGLAVALAACGAGADGKAGAETDGKADGGTSGAPQDAGAPLARTADIPVGGGKVLADQGVVITQPTAGEFKAFSSKCTHQGCAVSGVGDGVITCPCHQSLFDVSDGSVKGGPATAPLPPTPIKVEGDAITLA